uniref:Uncharacterized protein n=1 Tax=Setaria italica TaxID=4555 RepID=K3XNM0_SETIT
MTQVTRILKLRARRAKRRGCTCTTRAGRPGLAGLSLLSCPASTTTADPSGRNRCTRGGGGGGHHIMHVGRHAVSCVVCSTHQELSNHASSSCTPA